MFSKARIRLTAWYAGVLAAFIALLGTAVYLVERHQLFSNVNHGLHVQAARIETAFVTGGIDRIIAVTDTAPSAYNVSVTDATGTTTGRDPINQESARAALIDGTDMRTVSAPGGHLRVLSERISPTLVLQVARSLEPEEEALDHLLVVLLLGGGAAVVVATIGGWFLAGKALTPVQEAFERQNAFVADASHELRTPLAVIRANAEFLQESEPASEEASEIVSETDRLSSLVDSLLAVARGDTNGAVAYDELDLGAVVEGSAASMRSLATERGITLDISATPELRIRGSREQLRQLVVILVDNALRYTGSGGHVEVDVTGRDGSAVVAVTDTGIGIPPEALGQVFERFYRADEARNRDSGGAGLGLAIAQKLVDEHGGSIAAESEPGEGSTFTVTLPLAH
jgi:two-component system, OmpR family, sensor histidine kinase CiaH